MSSAKKAVATPATKKPAVAPKVSTQEAPAPKAAVTTLTLKQLAAEIAESQEMAKKEAESLMTTVVDQIVTHLKDGVRIRLNGLGILEVKVRAARTGRNPATGEQIEIKASKKVAFRPAKELKEAI